jgi:hypothetical protein
MTRLHSPVKKWFKDGAIKDNESKSEVQQNDHVDDQFTIDTDGRQ